MQATWRRNSLKSALEHIHSTMQLKFGFRLWDGTHVPANPPQAIIAINDPGVISALLRRPRIETLVDAWVQKRVDIEGVNLFEMAELRPPGKASKLAKNLNRRLLAKAVLPFLFAPSKRRASSGIKGEGARDGSETSNKRNIAHHYDVSNEFYALFLDEQMLYTCAYFTKAENTLDQAQRDKLDMICRKLRLEPGDRLLDIGCGWGALICHAAEHYGVTAKGVTLSEQQVLLGRKTIAERGLEDRVSIELQDFSKLSGTFTKISSIGMFEHVGLANHEGYFQAVKRLLEPRGIYLHHAITRPGKRTEKKFRKKPAEYKALIRYIFPGGELDHIGMSLRNLEATGFEVHDVEGWREHYAYTTSHWATRLMSRKEEAIALVGEETFRMWALYLAGVSLAFERGSAQIFQTVATRKTKSFSGMPLTRASLYKRENETC
ncbi:MULTISPECIES: cyclopropane-fatty-acyl-phospholipid synthase family protein [unclassified Pseudovibrio]|uniref:SAM-dependent methyltransferase n=1 Tax=unclassified Pseudovibrio TaxID=2627060 RepID=UPI0007AE40D5|nr:MULTISPECIES: cyclopropane-fatty-acyl-phospholipid synthase family protein [unclassified Pseudovibrio]KZK93213.1 Cyclopropane mycolic acid synthase 1 [Pseudovibrio sp. W74]KZL07104.1 Cyclopropane mycolic acid synthase 1 [Pseudovibrio sp. Ad14]